MSQLKVNSISDAAGANGNAITLATDGTCTAKVTNNLSNRNLIINGAMQIAQRATSSTSHGLTTVDRISTYETNTNAGTKTWSQADITSGGAYDVGFRKAFKIATSQAGNTSTASAYMSAYSTKLEAQDIANSGWKYVDPNSKVTLSFWIKASTADNFQLQLVTDDGTKKKYNTTVAATTSWTKITKTIPGHADLTFANDNGKGLTVQLIVATGSDMAGTVTQDVWGANTVAAVAANQINTWLAAGAGSVETTGWQLEVSDHSTSFEHRSYTDELLRCQRYYHNYKGDNGDTTGISGAAWDTNYFTFYIQHPVSMRANPTLKGANNARFQAENDGDSFTITDCSIINVPTAPYRTLAFSKSSSGSGTAGQAGNFQFQSDSAMLGFDSEL